MTATEDIIQKIRRKAKSKTFEVEHLFVLLTLDNKSVNDIREIAKENNWKTVRELGTKSNSTSHEVPFGSWADLICLYLENGILGLYMCGLSGNKYFYFSIEILKQIGTTESFDKLFSLLKFYNPLSEIKKTITIIDAINFIVSFKNKPLLDKSIEREVADYLIHLIDLYRNNHSESDYRVAMCLYALRGLGDESTIEQIKQMPLIKKSAYLGAEKLAINAIKKRLKAENDSI